MHIRIPNLLSRFLLLCAILLSIIGISACSKTESAQITLYKGTLIHFLDDPTQNPDALQVIENGALVVGKGYILASGKETDLTQVYPDAHIVDVGDKWLMPGFVDGHIHYPQTEMIASHGEQLLEWLQTYTFPTERKFSDKNYATRISKIFLNELIRNGTTTALVFGTVHPESVEALFEEAYSNNMRLIAGKVLMDRNASDFLLDTPETGYSESKKLIEQWHEKGRLQYAVTPRFAPTSSPEQLRLAATLFEEFHNVYMHTHLSENKNEVAWVSDLFPNSQNYLDVYDSFGLTGNRAIFAHSIHLSDTEMSVMQQTGSAISFCPTSNLFLGSGLFDLQRAESYDIPVAMGTDVGAGTSFSMFQTLNEAYKVTQLRKAFVENPADVKPLTAEKAFYLATLGGARALHLDEFIGNLETGKEADFLVIDPNATPLLSLRMSTSKNWSERLFALQMLADDRAIDGVYVMGIEKKRR